MFFVERLGGTPHQIGVAYGRAFRHVIAANCCWSVQHPNAAWSDRIEQGEALFKTLRDRHLERWPWLAQEMAGIAEGSGVDLDLIERMNFRIWQCGLYGAGSGCSNFIATLPDGRLLVGGSLDDPRHIYGVVDVTPAQGYRYIGFPLCGTVWVARGMNQTGLSLATSSMPLPGLRIDPTRYWQQDLCLRVVLQTCSTVEEVVAFFEEHRTLLNMIVADADGRWAAFTCGPDGVHRLGPHVRCLTNHLLEPVRGVFERQGWNGRICSASSQARWEQLHRWLGDGRRPVTLEEAKRALARRDGWPDRSVNNAGTAFMMLSLPQACPRQLWIADAPVLADRFERFDLTPRVAGGLEAG